MSLIKPGNISGLDSGHALYANIASFLEFGQTDTDLVNSEAITTGAAVANHDDLGECRVFNDQAIGITVGGAPGVPIGSDHTVVAIYQSNATFGSGGSASIFLSSYGDTQNYAELELASYTGYDFRLKFRSQSGATLKTSWKPFTDDATYQAAHGVACVTSLNAEPIMYVDGSLVAVNTSDGNQTLAFGTDPTEHDILPSCATTSDVSIAAIIVFDRVLSSSELALVTTDPYALVESAQVTIDQTTVVPGGTISGSYSNFSGAPAASSDLTITGPNSNTITVSVTVTDNGDGTGTFTGAMPAQIAAGNTGTTIMFGDNTTATLTDPGA